MTKWTVLVYMAGMNNLDAEADIDIAEMVAAKVDDDLRVLVFVKQPVGARRFEVGGAEEKLPSDIDSGSPQTVIDFVRWGVDKAPSARSIRFSGPRRTRSCRRRPSSPCRR